MNELQIFKNNEFGEIRTKMISNEPYFMLSDVCRVLEIKNSRDAKSRLNEYGVGTTDIIDSLGRIQKADFINESNLYKLVFQSRKPQAEKFSDWVTSEVLPTIRKHGAYMTSEVIEKTLSDPDYLIRLATNLKEEKAKRALAEAQIERNKPKVLFADSCEVAENSILIGEFAKRLKQNGYDIGQNKLFEWLRQHDYLCKSGERKNLPTQYSMERGLFEVKTRIVSNPNGSVRTTSTTKVTGKGQIYFTNKFLRA
ncbi:MAG: phage antirepressor KilAC domain-containing protein [Finegoldia magna]|uniref:phage antirepressor KilAC domain-containing protein n=1 Tax=Finegoldia magna TaxID=1260 RepID=UPI0029053D04|nr:phage antirepressor KilAC domain-containing protein [Finegoldia magna]MDU2574753.1 phage antirepressor KilAC domain-containing protein [Finegoldia magna]